MNWRRWFHVVEADEVMSPRTGLIVERYSGRTVGIHLIVAITGRTPRLMFEDYRQGAVYGLPRFWLRIAVVRPAYEPDEPGAWRRFIARGVELAPRPSDRRWRLIPRT